MIIHEVISTGTLNLGSILGFFFSPYESYPELKDLPLFHPLAFHLWPKHVNFIFKTPS